MKFIKTAWRLLDKDIKYHLFSLASLSLVLVNIPIAYSNVYISLFLIIIGLLLFFYINWKYFFEELWKKFKEKVNNQIEEDKLKQ